MGNRVLENDPLIAEAMRHKLGAADTAVSGARPLYIIMGCLGAEAQDGGDFPVGFAEHHQLKALQLAPAKPRPLRLRRKRPQSASGAKSMRTDEFRAMKSDERNLSAQA